MTNEMVAGGMVLAEVQDPNLQGSNGYVEVYFFLDRDGRLIKHYVDVFIYSL